MWFSQYVYVLYSSTNLVLDVYTIAIIQVSWLLCGSSLWPHVYAAWANSLILRYCNTGFFFETIP